MLRRSMSLVFKPVKNNYVVLPEGYFRLITPYINGCIQMTIGGTHPETVYMSWAPYPGTTLHDTEIGLNASVASSLGLKQGTIIKCVLVKDVAKLRSVTVSPCTESDWKALEASASRVENTLLDQTSIVNRGQNLVVWLNKSITVTLSVDALSPDVAYGRLEDNTELIVAPYQKSSSTSRSSSATNFDLKNSMSASQLGSLSRGSSASSLSNHIIKSTTMASLSRNSSFRRPQKNEDKIEAMLQLKQLLHKEISRAYEFRTIPSKWHRTQPVNHIYIRPLPGFDFDRIYILRGQDRHQISTSGNGNGCNEYLVHVRPLEPINDDGFPENTRHPSVQINENLMRLLGITEFEKITLRPKTMVTNFVERIDVHPATRLSTRQLSQMEQQFKRYVLDLCQFVPLLLNQDQVIALGDTEDEDKQLMVTVKLYPDTFKYCLIDGDMLTEAKVRTNDEVVSVEKFLAKDSQTDSDSHTLQIVLPQNYVTIERYDEIIAECVDRLRFSLGLDDRNRAYAMDNLLIVAPANSGKSVLCEKIVESLLKKPHCCYFDVFYCGRAKGRKPESLSKDLRQFFVSCAAHSPAVLLLENLDVLAKQGAENVHDADYSNKVSEIIKSLMKEFTGTGTHPISVIATVSNLNHVNKRLYSARGEHLFQTVVTLPQLESGDRMAFLRHLCHQMSCSKRIDWAKFATLTEGYAIGDLVQLAEKAIFIAFREQTSPKFATMTEAHLHDALQVTNSYCLQGIEQRNDNDSDDNDNGDDIPGLESAVEVLEEVIMWPARFPGIFQDSPLRNQAGVLLYGPPGTGKTYLVGRLARTWGLRLISVKGPELLAKYIGQSEENVRNLFDRARKMRPCVLFFDEFDSLAPRRGHDSTGVTDRVVNQLLTELDGVESLHGVTVIGATSRPELLDPALLRSGRIDRLVECHLPNAGARLSIYQHLCAAITLAEDVDLKVLASRSDQFTGADIKSVITSANMGAIKEFLATHSDIPDTVPVTQLHLLEALDTTRPSLSATDLQRYKKTYAIFANKDKKPQSRKFVAQRATLA